MEGRPANPARTARPEPVEGRSADNQYTPLILFGKGNAAYLDDLRRSGAEGLGVDWLIELGDAAQCTQGHVALQGNLDPATL